MFYNLFHNYPFILFEHFSSFPWALTIFQCDPSFVVSLFHCFCSPCRPTCSQRLHRNMKPNCNSLNAIIRLVGRVWWKVCLDRHKLWSDPALIFIKGGQPWLLWSTLGLYEAPHGLPQRCKWLPAHWTPTNGQSCIQDMKDLKDILVYFSSINVPLSFSSLSWRTSCWNENYTKDL